MVWCTPNPSAPCVFQQARQLSWTVPERAEPVKFLIRDREVAVARERASQKNVWTISGQFFAEQHAIPGSHPSYRHEEPASPNTCVTLSRNRVEISGSGGRFGDLQTELGGLLFE